MRMLDWQTVASKKEASQGTSKDKEIVQQVTHQTMTGGTHKDAMPCISGINISMLASNKLPSGSKWLSDS